jgi:hypothetical protein
MLLWNIWRLLEFPGIKIGLPEDNACPVRNRESKIGCFGFPAALYIYIVYSIASISWMFNGDVISAAESKSLKKKSSENPSGKT